MAGLIKGKGALFSALNKEVAESTQNFGRFMDRVTTEVHFDLLEKTPVNTGQTIRNYVWTEGTPFAGVLPAIGSGEVEPTNQLELGQESRRPANEIDSTISRERLDFTKPFKKYIVTNNSPAIGGLERGIFPVGDDYVQRSPNGMFLITEQTVKSKLKSGILK